MFENAKYDGLYERIRFMENGPERLHIIHEMRGIVETLNRYRAEAGRDDRPFHVVAALNDAVDVDGYRRAQDAGVTHVMTMPWIFYGGPTEALDQKRDGIRRFGDEIVAKLA